MRVARVLFVTDRAYEIGGIDVVRIPPLASATPTPMWSGAGASTPTSC
jgi:hypothetical protein